MINEISIHNFKSIVSLDLELGRFNVIIGPNGCGKSNILEAISFASAAAQNKLDYEYLVNRDVRMAEPKFMVNAFEEDDTETKNEISDEGLARTNLGIRIGVRSGEDLIVNRMIYHDEAKTWMNIADPLYRGLHFMINHPEELGDEKDVILQALIESTFPTSKDVNQVKQLLERLTKSSSELNNFLTYRPTEHFLRKAFETSIFPLGVHGEGLLKYLKEAVGEKNVALFEEINEGLFLLDWFDGFRIPDDLLTNEYRLSIGDRFLKDSLHYFDEKSTNEGFLFLLFYLTLFNSKDTPRFFAIDNIESALNPKLMTKLTDYLVGRAFANDKQVIVTTHSPFVLDALDLSNDDVRLFVARRNIDGHTRLERIPYREDRTMKLSQLWMSGLIGGLPDNF